MQSIQSDEVRTCSRATEVLLILSLVVSWAVLMWPLVDAGPLVLDEHCSYWIIDAEIPGSRLSRALNYAAIPPLSSWLQEVFLRTFGKSEFIFRLPSALCMLGAILVTFQVGREMGNVATGGMAALLLAWHPEAMDEVRIARCYGLLMLLSAGLVWMALRWKRSPASPTYALLWSVAAVGVLWTHYTSALLVACSGLYVAAATVAQGKFRVWTFALLALAAMVVFAGMVPLLPALFRLSDWGPYLNFSSNSVSVLDVFGPFWWIGLPTTLLFAGLQWWRSENKLARSALWLSAACSVIPMFVILGLSLGDTSSLANPRYRVAYAPGGCCLLALLLTTRRRWWVSCGLVLLILAASWAVSPRSPWETGRLGSQTEQQWRELNQYLRQTAKPGDAILVQSGLTEAYLIPFLLGDDEFSEYVACRVSRFYVDGQHRRYALPFLWQAETGVREYYAKLLVEEANKGASIWIAAATDTDLNQQSVEGIQAIATAVGLEVGDQKCWSRATLLQYVAPDSPGAE